MATKLWEGRTGDGKAGYIYRLVGLDNGAHVLEYQKRIDHLGQPSWESIDNPNTLNDVYKTFVKELLAAAEASNSLMEKML